MRVLTLFCLCFAGFVRVVPGAELQGTVLDSQRRHRIVNASLYLDNTAYGTFSDSVEQFVLQNVPFSRYTRSTSDIVYIVHKSFVTLTLDIFDTYDNIVGIFSESIIVLYP